MFRFLGEWVIHPRGVNLSAKIFPMCFMVFWFTTSRQVPDTFRCLYTLHARWIFGAIAACSHLKIVIGRHKDNSQFDGGITFWLQSRHIWSTTTDYSCCKTKNKEKFGTSKNSIVQLRSACLLGNMSWNSMVPAGSHVLSGFFRSLPTISNNFLWEHLGMSDWSSR